jgi:hypothetical protein
MIYPRFIRVHPWLLLFLVLPLGGCGANKARVNGTVTLDGKPLTLGVVTFHATNTSGAVAIGVINEQGNYQLQLGTDAQVPVGEYKVTVSAQTPTPSPEPGVEGGLIDVAPVKYAHAATSGWKFQLQPGSQRIDLKMTSQP